MNSVRTGLPQPARDTLAALYRLAHLPRAPASAGERAAAELLAHELTRRGVRAWIEPERVHGTYWVPLGLMTGAVALASRRGRPLATSIGLVGALSIADELNIGRRPLRQVLRQRNAHNVLGRIDPPEPDGQVLVVHAHHDAAPTGVVFHPLVPKLLARAAGGLMERFAATPAPMWGAVIGPAAVAIGGLLGRRRVCRFGGVLAGAYAAAMANIGFSPTVPGANDNLSGVLALLELA